MGMVQTLIKCHVLLHLNGAPGLFMFPSRVYSYETGNEQGTSQSVAGVSIHLKLRFTSDEIAMYFPSKSYVDSFIN